MTATALDGGAAIVTGGAQGIGRGIVRALAEAGAAVAIADIQEEPGRALVDEIVDTGGKATFVRVDLSRESDIENMVKATVDAFGHLDILVNNARPRLRTLSFEDSLDEWDTALDVLLKASALAVKYALPHFVRAGGGSVVNISSTNAFFVSGQPAAYHVAKAGLNQLTRYLARELGPRNVRVNAVCPGLVDLPEDGRVLTAEAVNRKITESIVPLQRAASPQDIGNAVCFLCSDQAAYITGQILTLDGGTGVGDHFEIARRMVTLRSRREPEDS